MKVVLLLVFCLLQPLEMDERAVFLRFELFAKRLNKLISMFTTVHQFSSLEQHTHIAGAPGVSTTLLTVFLMPTAKLSCW